jgi:hypothetical protein
MMCGLARQHGTASLVTLLRSIAAVVLVLHWALPGPPTPPLSSGPRDRTASYSSELRSAPRGTLPRLQPRIASIKTSLPKVSQIRWITAGKPLALLPAGAVVEAHPVPVALSPAVEPVPSAHRARAFDARAPPALNA